MTVSKDNLVWMDLEMTGLDPEIDTILEMATIVTDKDLNILAEGPNLAIHHDKQVLDTMNEWCKKQHAASGLSDRATASEILLAQAEAETLAFIRPYADERTVPLCGNSIHQDRRFLVRYMPQLEAYLHYRMVDVSTIKELVKRWYPEIKPSVKQGLHLALDDVRESIAELRYYREQIFR
ncbi:MAG: oligoribonuclease [Mariprofundaceae bacterium]|nr:oligoribonuclease [Mariprofundaceae bacterium]